MLSFDDRGLIPAVVQDATTHQVLTLAYMDAEALRRTLEGPDVWFYSRSRRALWHKGETSGNYMKVKSVTADCDGDSLLVQVEPAGPACHTGDTSCFHDPDVTGTDAKQAPGPGVLARLFDVIEDRRQNPVPGSYTAKLFAEGRDRIAQKVIEEAGETAIAGLRDDGKRLTEEMADLFYNVLVLMSAAGLNPDEVWAELGRRRARGAAARGT